MIAKADYSYAYVPETQEELDWADLPTVDLSLFTTDESKKALAQTLLDAVKTKGFFYLSNFGLSQEQVDRQYAIGSEFYAVPLEERMKSKSDLQHGNSNGYAPAGKREVGEGLRDRKEEYNVPIHDDAGLTHPAVIQEHIDEIKEFEHFLHDQVLSKLYDLIAIGLEVPPDSLREIHEYRGGACGILRYMRYSPYTDDELSRLHKPLYAGGHTDSCAITLLFRQPVAALQIKDPQSGDWKWVKPMDGAVTVNAGDVLTLLTGGFIRSTIHRVGWLKKPGSKLTFQVTIPPKDQRRYARLGVIYFSRPPKPMLLNTIKSRVLEAAGCGQNDFERSGNPIPTAGDFQIHKEHWQQGAVKGDEILPGFIGKRYT